MTRLIIILPALFLLAGCSTPQSRARANPEQLEAFPPEVRERILAGVVDIGFTEEMVLMSLGKPDRRYTRRTAEGQTTTWVYHRRGGRPRFSVGVGTGFGRGSGVYGGGVSVGTGGRLAPEERIRVTFSGGEVISVQEAEG